MQKTSNGGRSVWPGGWAWLLLGATLIFMGLSFQFLRDGSQRTALPTGQGTSAGGVVPTRIQSPASSPRTFRSLQGDGSSSSDPAGAIALQKVQFGSTPFNGTADLRDPSGIVRTFVAGATLRDGTKVLEIHANQVLLEKDQQLLTLHLAP